MVIRNDLSFGVAFIASGRGSIVWEGLLFLRWLVQSLNMMCIIVITDIFVSNLI